MHLLPLSPLLLHQVLEMEGGAASVAEQAAEVVAAMDEEEEHVYLIVHNIDGAMLRWGNILKQILGGNW